MFSKINNTVIRKFLTFGRGSGKTISIVNQAKIELSNGKKCAIVIWAVQTPDYSDKESFKIINDLSTAKFTSFEKIHIIYVDDVLEILQKEVDNLDNSETWWKNYPQFEHYDYLYIDAECYEKIIFNLLDQVTIVKREINDMATHLKTKADELGQIGD